MLVFIRNFFIISTLFFVVSCSSKYTYHVKPTPIKKGTTKYVLKEVKVILSLGANAVKGDTTFASEDKLTEQFTDSLNKHLKDQGIVANSTSESVAEANVTINYHRKFTIAGKSLGKPTVSHTVDVLQENKKVASFTTPKYTTKYGYFKDFAVNVEIVAFQWDEEDEIQDVDLISKLIINDLKELGD